MARYSDNVIDQAGQPLPGVQVSVVTRPSSGTPVAAALADDAGVSLGSAVATGLDGVFSFNTATGDYTLRFRLAGSTRVFLTTAITLGDTIRTDLAAAGGAALIGENSGSGNVQAALNARAKTSDLASDTGGSMVELRHTGSAVRETLFASSRKTASLKSYGAVGGNLAADNAAMVAALANNDNILIDATGTPFLLSPFTMQGNNQRLYGAGPKSCIQMTSGETPGSAFLSSGGFSTYLENFRIFGGYGGGMGSFATPQADRTALKLNYNLGGKVKSMVIDGWGYRGITPFNTSSSRAGEFVCEDTLFRGCWEAVDARFAEYTKWDMLTINSSRKGFHLASGNLTLSNSIISDNYDNIWLYGVGDANNGHGSIINCRINHAEQWALICEGITNGHVIIGNDIFYGNISITNCVGLKVVGNTISVVGLGVSGACNGTIISQNTLIMAPGATPALNNVPTFTSTNAMSQENWTSDGTPAWNNFAPLIGQNNYTAADTPLVRWGENGSIVTDGWVWTTHGGTGTLKLFPRTSGVTGSVPIWVVNRTSGKVTSERTALPVYADNAAALAGGLVVGANYRTATGVRMEVY